MYETSDLEMHQPVLSTSFRSKVIFCFALAVLSSLLGFFFAANYLWDYFAAQPNLIWVAFILELGLVFTARFWSTKQPLNYFLFAFFSFLTGIVALPIVLITAAEAGGFGIIWKALLATVFTFTAAATVGLTTKRNLAGMGGFLVITLIGMIVVSIIGLFIPWSNTFEMIFSGIGVILFTGYTMYDMERLKHYPEDQYMMAALALYLDIFNLFLYILRLMRAVRS